MLTLEELKEMHENAYVSHQTTRERASNDMIFHWITQWDDEILEESQLAFRGEFDVMRRATRSIMTDLDNNPVQVDFEPVDENAETSGELLDGMYRIDTHSNLSIEAFDNGDLETVICGMGAWQLDTEYESLSSNSNHQVIRRLPIFEANSRLFWDPNDKTLEKSLSTYASLLTPYTTAAYKKLKEELTGEDSDVIESNFSIPDTSYTFPWIESATKTIWVTQFFHREEIKDALVTFVDPLGNEVSYYESALKDKEDQLIEEGYEVISEKDIERYQVTKYIASGEDILDSTVIAGAHIPIVVEYGDYAVVDNEIHYEGVVRLAKDPQRLRNFQMSYLADIASRSPREKPLFYPEQVVGHEDMYSDSGAENNFPYALINRMASDGSILPPTPIGVLPAPNIPPALAASIDLSRQAVEDVANPGVPEKIPDREISGRAVGMIQARIDMQSAVYQKHRKHARRRDGTIYASIAAEINDVPRSITVERPDGSRKQVKMMDMVFDAKTNEFKVLNDINNVEFKVYTKISSNYASQKEQVIYQLEGMVQGLPAGDPMRTILMLKQLRLMDGVDFEDIRRYANNELIKLGVREPETEEEIKLLKQHKEAASQPSPEMVLAKAEELKGQAANKDSQVKLMAAQAEAANKNAKVQVDGFNAQTKRFESQIDAQEAGAKIDKTNAEAFGTSLENQVKLIQLTNPKDMSDDQLAQIVMGG